MQPVANGDPYYALYSEKQKQWYVVNWLGSLAHTDDGRAAFFDSQEEANACAIKLCRDLYFEWKARQEERRPQS